MRFYGVDRGEIAVDGTACQTAARSAARACAYCCLQETWLKCATVHPENIAYGKWRTPRTREVKGRGREKPLMLHSFLSKRLHRRGYDTVIAAGHGGNLSAGRKQLYCHRAYHAVYYQMLILDEQHPASTPAPKYCGAAANVEKLMQGRTSFVVAHRLSTIQSADRILVMNAGHIIEQNACRLLLLAMGLCKPVQQPVRRGITDGRG